MAVVIADKIAALVQETVKSILRVDIEAVVEEKPSCQRVGKFAGQGETDQGPGHDVTRTVYLA